MSIGTALAGKKYGSQIIGNHMAACSATPRRMISLRCPVRLASQAENNCAKEPSSDGNAASHEICAVLALRNRA